MRYKVTFRVSRENSGRATYIGKKMRSYTPPYQIIVEDGKKSEQHFSFFDIDTLNRFLKESFEAFSTDFVGTDLKMIESDDDN